MESNSFWKLIAMIVVAEAAGAIGAAFTVSAIPGWYAQLNQPVLSPPNWVFAPVWTLLYVLMGIAAFLVWQKGLGREDVRRAMTVWGLQLALNALWSVIFFGLRSPAAAFVEVIALWLSILWTIFVFSKISRPAMFLLLPYFAWVTFAAYLNYAVWMLNPA